MNRSKNIIIYDNEGKVKVPNEYDIYETSVYALVFRFPFINKIWIQYVYINGKWVEIKRSKK